MSDPDDGLLDGKGNEMLPERGNPFAHGLQTEADQVEDAIRAWESERSGDLSSSAEGSSSRRPKPLALPDGSMPQAPQAQANTDEQQTLPSDPPHTPEKSEDHIPTEKAAQPESAPEESRSQSLLERAEDTHWKINDLIDHLKTASQLLGKVKQAKSLIQAGNYEEGEHLINEVEYQIHLAGRNKLWARREAKRVIGYEILWLTALLTLLYLLPKGTIETPILETIYSALVAALGSVLAMIYSSSRQLVAQQEAPPHSNLWFTIQPVSAMIIGGFIHLAFSAAGQLHKGAEELLDPPYLIFLIAGLGGFFQAHLFRLRSRED